MGLFGKKEVCALCGGKISMLTCMKVADGTICGNCFNKTTRRISVPRSRTVADIERNIQDATLNRKLYSVFTPQDFGNDFRVDFTNKLWCVASSSQIKNRAAYLFRFDEISSYDFTEDGKTINKSGAGTAIAGGLLFGGVGLVAGGLAGRKTKEMINKLSINIKTTNEWIPKVEIDIITEPVKKGSLTYNARKSYFERVVEVIERMIAEA